MAKRGNSEGSITKRKDGRWMARMSLPDMGRKSFYGKTRQEVAQKLHQAQRTLADGLPVAGGRQAIGAFLEAWLSDSAAPRVRPKTLVRYQELVRLHITQKIGRILLARLCHPSMWRRCCPASPLRVHRPAPWSIAAPCSEMPFTTPCAIA